MAHLLSEVMRSALVGSRAAHSHHPALWPKPRDRDLILSFEAFQWIAERQDVRVRPIDASHFVGTMNGEIAEFEIAWPGSAADEFLDKITATVPSMDWLFTLKASHRFLKDSPHFDKTMRDYHVMKDLGCKIVDETWLAKREAETYDRPRPRLNRTKKEFFTDEVKYKYDHDSIHIAMAHDPGCPAYESYKSDNAEVMCSKRKWDRCDETTRLWGVLEETYVLALERSQVPFAFKPLPLDSFLLALEKVCTSITSGWFRAFAYDNYYKLLDMYDHGYVARFLASRAAGIVKEATP